jgi:hypothetical protein
MAAPASTSLIWTAILLMTVTCTPVWSAEQQENLIGCWSAAYEYDSLYNRDGSSTGSARLCSREPNANACGDRSYLHVTYCFDRSGNAYGGEGHCWTTMKGRICHGSDGLSGSYRLQGNRMNFFQATEGAENSGSQELAWSCSLSFSENMNVLEFGDCTKSMKTFFRDCDSSRDSEEYKTDKCKLASR